MASTKKTNAASLTVFQQQFDSIRTQLSIAETEETWDTIGRNITVLTAACNDTGSYDSTELVVAMRSISRPVINAMHSERGRLSGVAIDLIAAVALSLGVAFEPLLPHFFPVLLVLSSRTSKVTIARARTCIHTIIETTQLPSVLTYLMQSASDKSVSLRLTIVESTLACMNCFNPPDLEKDVRAKEIECIIRTTARDANADVRKTSRKVFEAYRLLLPSRLESFTAPLTPTTRKYLDIRTKAADKSKPTHSHPSVHPKAAQLSSSTSAVRGPSSRRPPTHTRSASSPSVAADVGTSGTVVEHPPRIRLKGDMGPPKVPDVFQPSRQPVMFRSASAVDRKRVVSLSAATRPTLPNTKPGASSARPIPVSNHAARPQPTDTRPAQAASVGARRVPISEIQTKLDDEKAIRARPRIENSVSTPAIRLVSTMKPALAEGSKPSAVRPAPNKDSAPTNRAMVKQKDKEPAKQRSLTQPTLSQMSRTKTIERRVPVASVSKPQWGKAAPRKGLVPATKVEQPAPKSAATPAPDELSAPHASTSSVVEPGAIPSVAKEETGQETDDPANDAETGDDVEAGCASGEEVAQSETPDAVEVHSEARATVTESPRVATPPKLERNINNALNKTPISELLLSIERGFLFTPSAPLSPPESYLPLAPAASLAIPFPLQTMWSRSEQQNEESGEGANKLFEGIRHLESRKALGDMPLNK